MSKYTAAIQAHIEILLKNNLLQNEVYNFEFESQKLTFGIETILTMKCSTQKKREHSNMMKYKNLNKSDYNIRKRTSFTPLQQRRLEKAFQKGKYISGCARLDLAAELGLEVKQVKVWFQNRRFKIKKFGSESDNHTDSEN